MNLRPAPWTLLLACVPAVAQTPPAEPKLPVIELTTYSEGDSRRCFAALDANADDRLSVFELAHGFEDGADPRDVSFLRSLDHNRDGYVDWAEFDQRVRSMLRLHGTFRCQPARAPLTVPAEAQKRNAPTDPAMRKLLDLTDTDGSDSLSRAEFRALVLSVGLPASVADQFQTMDRDASRALEPEELAPLVPILVPLLTRPTAPSPGRAFPGGWAKADRNRDGEVDAAELELALRRHDPFLSRWARAVIGDADRSGNGRLGPAEVLAEEQRRGRGAAPR